MALKRFVILRSAMNAQNGTVPAKSTRAICHFGIPSFRVSRNAT